MSKYSGSLRTANDNTALPATIELENGRVKIEVGSTSIGDWPLDDVVFEKIPSGYKLEAEGEHVLLDLDSADALAIGVLLNTASPEAKSRRWPKKDKESAPPSQEDSRPPKRKQEAKEKPAGRLRRPKKDSSPAEAEAVSPVMEPSPAPEPESAPPVPLAEPIQSAKVQDNDEGESAVDQEDRSLPGVGRVARTEDKILDVSERKLGPYLPKWVFSRLTVLIIFAVLVVAGVFPGFMSTAFLIIGGLLIALGAVVYTDSAASSRFLYGRTTPSHVFIVGTGFLALGIGLAVLAA